MSQASHSSSDDTVKTESDMQEIFVDSDSLDELTLVIEDIFSKRKYVTINNQAVTASNLIMRMRIVRDDHDQTDSDQNNFDNLLVLVDLSELNEPIDDITKMFLTLENCSDSLSLDTRICQHIFEKLRNASVFRLLTFVNSAEGNNSVSHEYTQKLKDFTTIVQRIIENSHEIFQNFHSRVLDGLSYQSIDEQKVSEMSRDKSIVQMQHQNMRTKLSKLQNSHIQNMSQLQQKEKIKIKVRSLVTSMKSGLIESVSNSVDDTHNEDVINKITSNILKELKIQKKQSKGT